MARYLVDQNIDVSIVDMLASEFGMDVDHVELHGMRRRSDEEIADLARVEGLVVITRDQHFSEIWHRSTDSNLNVVHVQTKDQTASGIVGALRQIFGQHSTPVEFRGTLVTVRPGTVRIMHRD